MFTSVGEVCAEDVCPDDEEDDEENKRDDVESEAGGVSARWLLSDEWEVEEIDLSRCEVVVSAGEDGGYPVNECLEQKIAHEIHHCILEVEDVGDERVDRWLLRKSENNAEREGECDAREIRDCNDAKADEELYIGAILLVESKETLTEYEDGAEERRFDEEWVVIGRCLRLREEGERD